jgi:hypothetical protein
MMTVAARPTSNISINKGKNNWGININNKRRRWDNNGDVRASKHHDNKPLLVF